MIPVIVESPYKGENLLDLVENTNYARAAHRDCLRRGEAPFGSHLIYTQPGVLDDNLPDERTLGIEAGFAWKALAKKTVVYIDRGISLGMKLGIEASFKLQQNIEFRSLNNAPTEGLLESFITERSPQGSAQGGSDAQA